MDEQETKVLAAFREMKEKEGSLTIKFQKAPIIIKETWKRNPTQGEIEQAIDDTLAYGYGSVETLESGGVYILKKVKKILL